MAKNATAVCLWNLCICCTTNTNHALIKNCDREWHRQCRSSDLRFQVKIRQPSQFLSDRLSSRHIFSNAYSGSSARDSHPILFSPYMPVRHIRHIAWIYSIRCNFNILDIFLSRAFFIQLIKLILCDRITTKEGFYGRQSNTALWLQRIFCIRWVCA